MKASPNEPLPPTPSPARSSSERMSASDGIDLALLEESLAKTVWERMLANDDALRLADLLQTAMTKHRGQEAMDREHDRITVRQLREIKQRPPPV